jgi:DtxR family transcriptional regulator, Mn-dependent transcriptional regulator
MTKTVPRDLSVSVGDYLKALWLRSQDGSVSTGDLATHLAVSPPSVTGMLNKLKKLDLVTYERYYGAQLTPQGEQEALRLIRRHRLVETFLIDYLDYSWEEVHQEAELMEHAMTDRFTERLAKRLGQPLFDPHGDPIPRADGTVPDQPSTPLAEVSIGKRLEVTRVRSQDADILQYIVSLGVKPGAEVEVIAREPYGGLLQITLGGLQRAVSRELASLIEGQVIS